ncbi:acyl-coenzyme A diphosphatase FITM2 isoform X2 [Cherax quadricarinatus]|uniref:acyl-coenzyme A diphosphatase FITM2 isoform X2 n=1 Tax=Cherax quadricarinatus TaxID=27406 RepID=UPI00387EB6AE
MPREQLNHLIHRRTASWSHLSCSVTCREPIRRTVMGNSDTTGTQIVDTQTEDQNKQVVLPSIWENIATWGTYYLHITPAVKIGYYFFTLLMLSMVKESFDVPHIEVLTGKHSVLNEVFVKKGWGITLSVFVTYQLLSLSLHIKWKANLKQLCVRALITTFFFFIWCVVIFQEIEKYMETCTLNDMRVVLTKRECLKLDGHVYDSYDISGHSYLMTYCVLIMMEESKEILYFLCLGRVLNGAPPLNTFEKISCPKLEEKEIKILQSRFSIMSPLVVLSFVCVCLLCLLWDFMYIITTIYYHTFSEKVIGTMLALIMWYLLYRQLFVYIFKYKFFLS